MDHCTICGCMVRYSTMCDDCIDQIPKIRNNINQYKRIFNYLGYNVTKKPKEKKSK